MKKIIFLALMLSFSLNLSSCSQQNTDEIFAFQKELNAVIVDMETLHTELNTLDTSKENASDTALGYLSDLKNCFDKLASIDVTDEEHTYITQLAQEGADYMSQSYDLFQKAYSSEDFDEANADLAYQYLERATTRIRVIVNMLHGNISEGVTVH